MPQLMFRCPYTNNPIRSGIELLPANLKAVSEYPISVHCPHCGCQHHGIIAAHFVRHLEPFARYAQ